MRQLVMLVQSHGAEIFGQQRQFRPSIARLDQQAAGNVEVFFGPGAGDHLQGGDFHGVDSGARGLISC